jgi:hypothetical protein
MANAGKKEGRKEGRRQKPDEPNTTSRQSTLANPGNRLPPACRSGHRAEIQRLFYKTKPKNETNPKLGGTFKRQIVGAFYETNPNRIQLCSTVAPGCDQIEQTNLF